MIFQLTLSFIDIFAISYFAIIDADTLSDAMPLYYAFAVSFSPTLFSLRLFSFYADYFRHAMLTLRHAAFSFIAADARCCYFIIFIISLFFVIFAAIIFATFYYAIFIFAFIVPLLLPLFSIVPLIFFIISPLLMPFRRCTDISALPG
jgi:hypothetical protein